MSIVWKCTIRAEDADTGVEYLPGFHYHTEDRILIGELGANDVAARIWEHLGSEALAMFSATSHVDTFSVREELAQGDDSVPAEGSISVDETGPRAVGDDRIPLAMCAVGKLHTDAGVRSGHGWIFLPPVENPGDLALGRFYPTSAYYLACKAFLDRLPDGFDQSGTDNRHYKAVVYSRTRRDRGAANWWFSVTSATVRTTPGWLRSRLTSP